VTTGDCVLPSDDGWTGRLTTFATRRIGDIVEVALF
jgi:hypothetical protein